MDAFQDGLGVAGAGKYGWQASRAAKGLSTTTRWTAGLDLLKGGTGLTEAGAVADAAGSAATAAKGVAGAAKLSTAAKAARFAKAAGPAVAKGSAVLGVALGSYELGTGIHNLSQGNTRKGTDQVVSGAADTITAGALGVAAVSSGTVVGVPVAAVALGVAGAAQAGKYAYKFRGEIADGAHWAANKVGQGVDWAGNKLSGAADAVGSAVSGGWNRLAAAFD